MKKIKNLLLLAMCFGLFLQANSAPVDRAVAKKVAITYCKYKTSFFKQGLNSSSVIKEQTVIHAGKPAMYVFNFEEGFVITSADDRARAIIAYSPEGSFVYDEMPQVVKWWLTPIMEYVSDLQVLDPKAAEHEQWAELKSGKVKVNSSSAKGQVGPLTTSKWDQSEGYNDSCPISAAGPGGRCLTGCVATSMGQIMYYHKYPAMGKGSNTYTHGFYGTISGNFEGVKYQWDSMSNVSNTKSKAYISQLLSHAGVSVNMNYGPDGSGAYTPSTEAALQNNFSFRSDIRMAERINYPIIEWQRLLKDNIDAHQPMIYKGIDDLNGVGGHAWVCDGYNDNNYFRMNWGWNGSGNGYYSVDTLKVLSTGRFNGEQGAVVNIAPIDHKFCYETRVYREPNFTFSDGSGLSYYKNGSDCRILIDLDTMAINLSFTYFNTEADHDFLKVYKGDAAVEDSLIGTYSGHNIPEPILGAQGGKLYLVFTSDEATQGEGWTASVAGTWQGIEESAVMSNNVRLYPNPVTDNLLVTVPGLSNSKSIISFMDITGRMVDKTQVQFSEAGNVFLNTNLLTSGIYIIKIETENKATFTSKLIKK